MILFGMTRLDDIERAIAQLSEEDLAKLRAWFEEFDARVFDEKIERDAKSGKLDRLAADAVADYKAGRTTDL
jgi:hypothetical protein